MVDRRRYVRHELAAGTVGVLTSKATLFMRVGPITDISEGGAAFSYAHQADAPKAPLRLHLFGPSQSHFGVSELPCTIIFDTFSIVRASRTPAGFCSIAFDDLSSRERGTLQEFIRKLRVERPGPMQPDQGRCSVDAATSTMSTGKPRMRTEIPKPVALTPRILVIDDEPMVLKLMSRVLEMQGYRVMTSSCPREALEVFRSNPWEIDLIITDYWMPPMTGAEFAREALRSRPDVPILLCTGQSDLMTDQAARELGFRKLAMKPLDRHNLTRLVQSTLDQESTAKRAAATGNRSDPRSLHAEG